MEGSTPSGGGGDLTLALEALEKGQVDEAIHLLQFATTMNPNSAEAHFHLGRAYQARENTALAEAAYRRAVALSPEHAPALCALGVLLARQQNAAEARRCLEAALQADPGCKEAEAALHLLPRPEDHATFAHLLDAASVSPTLVSDAPQRSHRLLLVTAIFGLSLVLALGVAFWQMQQMLGPQAPSEVETAGPSRGMAAEQPAGNDGGERDAEEAGTPEESGVAAGGAEIPPSAISYLERIYAAQEAFRADKGRYASLSELEAAGKIGPAAAAGQAVAECGSAVLSEDAPTADAFTVRATLPDGTVVTVNQEGELQAQ